MQTEGNSSSKMYANGRYWEAEKGVPWGIAWGTGKEGLFWGCQRFSGSDLLKHEK